VLEPLEEASDDAIAGIPSAPGAFETYTVIDLEKLLRYSEATKARCLNSLSVAYSQIEAWARPLHTLPPLASPPEKEGPKPAPEPETLYKKIGSSLHRERYKYEQLPSPLHFRLIKIESSRPWLMCKLETFSLRDRPKFQGLSYTWGTSGQNSDIWCNDRLVKVSSNLKRGLQRLHSYSKWTKAKYYWIDQICINQADFSERNHQVRLMRAIYQQAQNTVIWLGSEDSYAKPALSLVADIYKYSLSTSVEQKKVKDKKTDLGESEDSKAEDDFPAPDDKRWAALPRFLELPWFERCWIIQEVVVSSGDPVILCGSMQFYWSRLEKAITWLIQYGTHFRTDRIKLVTSISELGFTRDLWELQALLQSTRPFQATNSRDKVYALLGLAGETGAPDQWPLALAPNYGRTVRELYTEVTRYCIQQTKSLSILSQVEGSTESGNDDGQYPSWVPRLDIPRKSCSLSTYTVKKNKAGWKTLEEKFNRVSRDMQVNLDTHKSANDLRVEGLRITTVQSCFQVVIPDSPTNSSTDLSTIQPTPKLLKTVVDLYETCKSRLEHLTLEKFAQTFFLVTTAGVTPEQTDARAESMVHFRAFIQSATSKPDSLDASTKLELESRPMYNLRTALKSNLGLSTLSPAITPPASTVQLQSPFPACSISPSLESLSTTTTSFGTERPDPSRYSSALTPLMHRRLFITSSGHLGLGPATMMSGDAVVVLFGGKVPFVLRHVDGDRWRFVGECYVAGFMNGEGLEVQPGEKSLDTEWFDLV
jgi:hypothetical protein